MAKSSMGAARMRRTNRRIEFHERAIRETATRDYVQQRKMVDSKPPSAIRRFYNRVSKWLSGFFSPSYKAINKLNLTIDKGDRGRGARQLRAIFGQQLKMISTLDGRPV